jgi:hypothetical protein
LWVLSGPGCAVHDPLMENARKAIMGPPYGKGSAADPGPASEPVTRLEALVSAVPGERINERGYSQALMFLLKNLTTNEQGLRALIDQKVRRDHDPSVADKHLLIDITFSIIMMR